MQEGKMIPISPEGQALKHNWPAQPTPLIGREQELAAVRRFLCDTPVRLLTLTGTAGVGKTRLALEAAMDLSDDFADGVYFVPLASISDSTFVASTIAQVLRLSEAENQSLLGLLEAYLHDKHLLLILDNFEHLMPATSLLVELLAACTKLKMLVTSREV